MRGIPSRLILTNIPKNKHIQPALPIYMGVHTRRRHQNSLAEEPDGGKGDDHHAEKVDEEVGVHAVDGLDAGVVCAEDGEGP